MITKDEIDAAKTDKGGWTKDQLEKWDVPWPPHKGWRQQIIKSGEQFQPEPEGETAQHPQQTQ